MGKRFYVTPSVKYLLSVHLQKRSLTSDRYTKGLVFRIYKALLQLKKTKNPPKNGCFRHDDLQPHTVHALNFQSVNGHDIGDLLI